MNRLTHLSRRITEATAFEAGIIAVIIINALLLGAGTSPALERQYGELIDAGYRIALVVFIVEALLKMTASSPRVAGYFKDSWNVFDFLVIVFALVPGDWAVRHGRTARAPAPSAAPRVDYQRSAV